MKTNSELKQIIEDGLNINNLEDLSNHIEYIYSLEETHAHEVIIDGANMDKLLMKQIELETD